MAQPTIFDFWGLTFKSILELVSYPIRRKGGSGGKTHFTNMHQINSILYMMQIKMLGEKNLKSIIIIIYKFNQFATIAKGDSLINKFRNCVLSDYVVMNNVLRSLRLEMITMFDQRKSHTR
jgi:hypothetical protein